VEEYWVIDPLAQTVAIYRQVEGRLSPVEGLRDRHADLTALARLLLPDLHTLQPAVRRKDP
jgi:Uma2 family endonuclease